jgi:hypothetical protein
MNLVLWIVLLFIVAVICLEILARIHYFFLTRYYIKKKEFPLSERMRYLKNRQYPLPTRIKLIFLGRWLIDEKLDEKSQTFQLSRMEYCDLFHKDDEKNEIYHLVPQIGFMPVPSQNLPHLTINSLGFRGLERNLSKPYNVKRVILLGGSTAFGRYATSDENSIAGQLEKLMNEQEKKPICWEVINLAIPGFISYQEMMMLFLHGFQYKPDYVISLTGINDIQFYLRSGKVNDVHDMHKVTAVYNAYHGGVLGIGKLLSYKLLTPITNHVVSVYYIREILKSRKKNQSAEEDLSPYVYTIW